LGTGVPILGLTGARARKYHRGMPNEITTGARAPRGPLGEGEFRRYIDAFNRSSFEEFGGYYAPDVDFDGRGGHFQGRDEVLSFYRRVKSRVRETLSVRDVIVGTRELVADVVTELDVQEDWPDFRTGPLLAGQVRRSENFIWYDVQDGTFKRIRAAHYRIVPESERTPAQVEPVPEASGAAGSEVSAERFAAYIEAFNRDDYAAFGDFYAPDVQLVIAGKHELRGMQAIFDYYRVVKGQTQRTIQVNRLVTAPNRLAAELQSEFIALEDLPGFIAGPMRKGGRIFINTFVIYELRDGKFTRIRSAQYRKRASE
jgi:predicted ester cyclase